jgi:hypothetical protein
VVELNIPKAAACVVLLGLIVPARAVAQSATAIDDVRKNYRIHFGGLYVAPTLMLKELGYDTNVFNEGEEPKGDFIVTLTPKVDLAVPIVRRALVKATVAGDLMYFARYPSERSVNPQLTLRGEAYANRVTLFGEVAHLNSRQRFNLEVDARVRHLTTGLSGGLAVNLTPKASVQFSARRSETQFDDDAIYLGERLKETLNGFSRSFGLTLRRQITPLTALAVDYERAQDRFPNSPVRNTDSFRVMPGVDLKPRALISGTARVGYRRFAPVDPRLKTRSGLVSQLGLSYTLLGATMFGVTFDRDFVFSYSSTTPYFVSTTVAVFVRRAVGGHFDVIGDAGRTRYDYERLGAPPADPVLPSLPTRVETTDRFGVNLGYRLKRQTRIGFGVSYSERSSSVQAARGYDALRFVTSVTTSVTR